MLFNHGNNPVINTPKFNRRKSNNELYELSPPELNEETIYLHRKTFERRSKMEIESSTRQSYLEASNNPLAKELLFKLMYCNEDEPCNSMACPLCNMKNRLHYINTTLKHYYTYDDELLFVTYIAYPHEHFDDDPSSIDVNKIKDQLRCYLKNAGINEIAIGCFEVDFDINRKSWIPHIHFIIRNVKQLKLKALRKSINASHLHTRKDIKNRPLYIQSVYNLIGALCYIYKFMPQARISRKRLELKTWGTYIKRTAKQWKTHSWKTRIRNEHAVNMLLMMDQFTMKDFEFRFGVRRNKRGISLIDKSRSAE